MKQKPCRQPGYQIEALDGEVLLFNPARERILYCNETASLIWHLCDGERTGDEIIALLVEAYPEAAEAIPGDVKATLIEFARHGAIRLE